MCVWVFCVCVCMCICVCVCLCRCVFMSVAVSNAVFICMPPQQSINATIYTRHEIEVTGISLQPIATTGENVCHFPIRCLWVGDSDYMCVCVCLCVCVCVPFWSWNDNLCKQCDYIAEVLVFSSFVLNQLGMDRRTEFILLPLWIWLFYLRWWSSEVPAWWGNILGWSCLEGELQ